MGTMGCTLIALWVIVDFVPTPEWFLSFAGNGVSVDGALFIPRASE